VLALKGYQHWAGRALVGLRAIELCADTLKGYRVAVYSSAPEVRIAAELASKATGIPIDCVPLGTHEDVLRLHGRARVSIGLSISDALSTSALEAMMMGSFPIQSNTSCINELLQDGETVILVPPNDPEPIAAAIQRAVTDDALVDRAADINTRVTAEHLDQSVVRPQVIAMYEKIGAQEGARGNVRRSP
jgi:glycosyltransferase involved in cell wall biosynthesis